VALVRCPHHGRIYDSAKDEGCPVCLSLPPGWEKRASAPAEPAKSETNPLVYMLLGVLVLIAAGVGGWRWFEARQEAQRQAEEAARREMLQPTIPDTTRFARADDLTPIRRARSLAAVIDGLLRANRSALLGFTEGPADTAVTDRTEKRRAKSYVQLATRWHARLDDATRDGHDFRYEPGVEFSLQMERANNALGAALAVARDAVPRDHVKSRADRQRDLTAITGYLRSARTELSNLPR